MQKSLTHRFLTIGVILAWAVYALLPTWEYQQMTEEEKAVIKKNIDRRNELARARYRKNKETREKQQKRSRDRYHRLKAQVTE